MSKFSTLMAMAVKRLLVRGLRPCHLPTTGDIAAVGDGRTGTQTRTFTTKQGDTVLYSKFGIGATDVSVQGKVGIMTNGLLAHVHSAALGRQHPCQLWCPRSDQSPLLSVA